MKRKKLLFTAAGILGALTLLLCLLFSAPLPRSTGSSDENTAFLAFTQKLFQKEISGSTLNLHYMLSEPEAAGIDPSRVSFGEMSVKARKKGMKALKSYQKELKTFTYDKLTQKNQLTYDILETQLSREAAQEPYILYEEALSPTTGTQAQLPILLAEYAFYKQEDADTYLSLLEQLPAYYESILSFEQEKAEAGLFMADFAVDAIVSQCEEFISSDTNYLVELFDEKIDALNDLSSEERAAYKEKNQRAVENHVIPAYRLLIEGLNSLKGSGTNEGGLCHYPDGRAYYEAVIRSTIGTDRSIDEIQLLLDEQLHADFEILSGLLAENPSLFASAPSLAPLEPGAILQDLQVRIQKDFPSIPQAAYTVKYVHPSLEAHLSPAFYLTPPLDRMEDHTIYINQASDYDYLSLFTTLAHEGYPGHLYQTIYEHEMQLNPVRSLFYFGGYIEGWATYVERYSYSLAPIDPKQAALLAANNSIILCLYSNADLGIHAYGWDFSDTLSYFSSYGISDEKTVRSIYEAIIEDPANYLKYYLGSLEIAKLKEQAAAALSDQFTLKDFHAFLLTIGPAPFCIFEKYMPVWLETMKIPG